MRINMRCRTSIVIRLPYTISIVVPLMLLGLAGCVMPVATDGRALGIGLFTAQRDGFGADANVGGLEGFGLAIGPGQLALGWVDWQWIAFEITPQPRSYRTPFGVFLVFDSSTPHPESQP